MSLKKQGKIEPSVLSTVGLSENETGRKRSGMPPQKYKNLNEKQC